MDYNDLIAGMKKYGSNETDICVHGLGITPEQVQENVVIAPWWEPASLPGLGIADYLSESDYSAIRIWNIVSNEILITYIRTGIGAPILMDALLSLGVTPCKQILFIGSVGSLDVKIGIGDIVIPEYSVCGDGASRYIAGKILKSGDVFGEKVFPDSELLDIVKKVTEKICHDSNVKWHSGKAFTIDTIFAQFTHIDEIINMGCNVIEMETASAFRAAEVINIPIAAIFSVSDNTVTNKSLISGRSKQEMDYRRYVRRELFPHIILETFRS
jgi:purine-nucleoside phosphorylase